MASDGLTLCRALLQRSGCERVPQVMDAAGASVRGRSRETTHRGRMCGSPCWKRSVDCRRQKHVIVRHGHAAAFFRYESRAFTAVG